MGNSAVAGGDLTYQIEQSEQVVNTCEGDEEIIIAAGQIQTEKYFECGVCKFEITIASEIDYGLIAKGIEKVRCPKCQQHQIRPATRPVKKSDLKRLVGNHGRRLRINADEKF